MDRSAIGFEWRGGLQEIYRVRVDKRQWDIRLLWREGIWCLTFECMLRGAYDCIFWVEGFMDGGIV